MVKRKAWKLVFENLMGRKAWDSCSDDYESFNPGLGKGRHTEDDGAGK